MHCRFIVAFFVLAACGDDGGSGVHVVDGGGDAAPVNCLASASYASVTPTMPEFHSYMDDDAMTDFYAFLDLNQDAMPDVMLIDLYAGFGAFEAGIPATGTTVQLTGAEASPDTCGACITIQVDYTENGSTEDQSTSTYIADGGTLNLTSATATSFAGNLNNVTFKHVNVDSDLVATPHPDGCTATLASVSFSGMPEPDPAVAASRFRITSKRHR